MTKLLQIPLKVISQDNGATVPRQEYRVYGAHCGRGQTAQPRALTQLHMSHQRPDMVVRFARQALPSLSLARMTLLSASRCPVNLRPALVMEKDLKSAVESPDTVHAGAKKLAISELLQAAHTNECLGVGGLRGNTIRRKNDPILLIHKPDDPLAQCAACPTEGPARGQGWSS